MNASIYLEWRHAEIEGLGKWLQAFINRLRECQTGQDRIVDDPEKASHILFLESGRRRLKPWSGNHLAFHPLVRRYPRKCYIWCSEDNPLTYLPGLYVSMPRRFFDRSLHRAFRYLSLNTERFPVPDSKERNLLYSFIGAPTSPLRREILRERHPPDTLVAETLNYNHNLHPSEDIIHSYIDVLARSVFTLCPPGSGTSSYRLFEAMRAGSVPVIISDNLVLPDGPVWEKCCLRVPERDAARLDAVLRSVTDSVVAGQAAQAAFRDYLSCENMLAHLSRNLLSLGEARQDRAREAFRRQWISMLFERLRARCRRQAG